MSKHKRHFESGEPSEAKKVVAFDASGVLIGMFSSVNKASDLTFISAQAISSCCNGKAHSSGGLYFRHFDDKMFTINTDSLGVLGVREFDKTMEEYRLYKPFSALNEIRKKFVKNLKSKK